ncbi:MAG: 6-phosphogluconolactonase, partial [Phycisphaeraceae bacterium]|nr:6-phosphogluconolactonase [Phycisphaeraceae bacterium]
MRKSQVHPIPVDEADPAAAYERELREHIPLSPPSSNTRPDDQSPAGLPAMPRLDFVLLGMGEDGHTASLFPGSPALAETRRAVANNDGPHVTPPPRVTMTYPLLNAARELAILVTGENKAATLRRVHDCLRHYGPDPTTLPVTGLAPHRPDTEVTWFLDPAAAGQEPDSSSAIR